MNFTILSGSSRKQSNSKKVSCYIQKTLKKQYPESQITILDFADNPLPPWHEEVWESGSDLAKQWEQTAARLRNQDAFVVVAPEWGGMAPSCLKNFFLYCSAKELGHKPALLVGVSSGFVGQDS